MPQAGTLKEEKGDSGRLVTTVTTVLVVLNCHGCRRGRHRRQAAEWFGLFVASWDSLGLGEILRIHGPSWAGFCGGPAVRKGHQTHGAEQV